MAFWRQWLRFNTFFPWVLCTFLSRDKLWSFLTIWILLVSILFKTESKVCRLLTWMQQSPVAWVTTQGHETMSCMETTLFLVEPDFQIQSPRALIPIVFWLKRKFLPVSYLNPAPFFLPISCHSLFPDLLSWTTLPVLWWTPQALPPP